MCGIVYIKRNDSKPASKQVYKRYKKQQDRGEDGYGYVAVQNGRVSRVKRYQFEHEAQKALEGVKATEILFHHRFPTSTPNVPEATHPIVVRHAELQYDYYVTHNGVITNDDELKDIHEKLGYAYTTVLQKTYRSKMTGELYTSASVYNDSESLAIELARTIEGKQKLVKAEGAIAYIVLQTTKQGKAVAVYYGTNGKNPLCVTEHKDFVAITSEGGKVIASHTCYRMDSATGITTEVASVKLAGHDAPAYTPRYGYMSESALSNWDSDDRPTYNRYGKRRHRNDTGEGYLWELETELDEVQSDLEMAKVEAQEALESGDAEEEDTWKYEIKSLLKREEELEGLIAKKALAFG